MGLFSVLRWCADGRKTGQDQDGAVSLLLACCERRSSPESTVTPVHGVRINWISHHTHQSASSQRALYAALNIYLFSALSHSAYLRGPRGVSQLVHTHIYIYIQPIHTGTRFFAV